jgi:hypothetical protein
MLFDPDGLCGQQLQNRSRSVQNALLIFKRRMAKNDF